MSKFLAGVGGMALLVVFIATNQKPITPESPPPQNCCLEYQRCMEENFQLKDDLSSIAENLDAALKRLNELIDLIKKVNKEKRMLKDSLILCRDTVRILGDSLGGCYDQLLFLDEKLIIAEDSVQYLSDHNELLIYEQDTLRSDNRQLRNDYLVLDASMKKNQLTYLIFMVTSVLSNILILVYYRGSLNY